MSLGPRDRRAAALVALGLLAAVEPSHAAPTSSGPSPAASEATGRPPAPAAEELELLARSLRPEGLAELEARAGPLAEQPLSEVEAELDTAAARVDGKLRLLLFNREPGALTELVLRLLPSAPALKGTTSLRVEDVRVDGEPAEVKTHGSVVEVALRRPLAHGTRLALTLAFHGKLHRVASGDDDLSTAAMGALGLSRRRGGDGAAAPGYGTFAVSEAGAVLADWYPQLAIREDGKWDRSEPGPIGDAARAGIGSALLTLTVPRGHRVVAAGLALGQHAAGQDQEVATFALAGLRGGLGAAVLAGAAEASADVILPQAGEPLAAGATGGSNDASTKAGPAVHVRAASLQGAAGAEALLSCARDALRELSRRFGPYPWSELALAEVPLTGGAGGVELPGLALIARALAGTDSMAPPGMLEFTCHHEVAHQWFPAVTGSDPRGAPWVDEALAQHAAGLVAEAVAGGGPAGTEAGDLVRSHFVALNYQGMRMLGGRDGKVARSADAFGDPVAYAGLVYGKAPLFFERVRGLVGDARHDAALRSLRAAWAFREMPAGAVLDAFTAADPAHAPQLRALEKRWLHQAHGDEDIPPLDSSELLGSLGSLGGQGDAAAMAALLRALGDEPAPARPGNGNRQQARKQRRPGSGAGSRGAPGSPGAPGLQGMPPGMLDDPQVRQALREMDKVAPGLRKLIEQSLRNGGTFQLPADPRSSDEDEPAP